MNHIFYVTFQRPACFLILIWIVFDGFSFAQRWLKCTIAFISLSEVGLVIERNDWLIQPVYQNAWDGKDRENKIPAGNSIFAYKDMRRWAILTGEVENEQIKVSPQSPDTSSWRKRANCQPSSGAESTSLATGFKFVYQGGKDDCIWFNRTPSMAITDQLWLRRDIMCWEADLIELI